MVSLQNIARTSIVTSLLGGAYSLHQSGGVPFVGYSLFVLGVSEWVSALVARNESVWKKEGDEAIWLASRDIAAWHVTVCESTHVALVSGLIMAASARLGSSRKLQVQQLRLPIAVGVAIATVFSLLCYKGVKGEGIRKDPLLGHELSQQNLTRIRARRNLIIAMTVLGAAVILDFRRTGKLPFTG